MVLPVTYDLCSVRWYSELELVSAKKEKKNVKNQNCSMMHSQKKVV